MKNIKLNKLLKLNNINIIDIRDHNEYKKNKLENSINIPYTELYNNYKLYLTKDKIYYIICETGYRSKLISKYLRSLNYNTIYVKKGMKSLY